MTTTTIVPAAPYLKPWYRMVRDEERIVFHYADSAVILQGRAVAVLMPVLFPLLDGRHDVATIELALGERARPAVRAALEALAEKGLLVGGPPPQTNIETVAFLCATGSSQFDALTIERTIAAATVVIAGDGAAARDVARGFAQAGVRRLEMASVEAVAAGPTAPADIVVAVPAQTEVHALRALNAAMLAAGQPWLALLEYDGRYAPVGPMFVPGESACYECFAMRRKANVSYDQEFGLIERAVPPVGQAPAISMVTAGIATLVALRWIVFRDPTIPNTVQAFSPGFDTALSMHTVLRVPRCPACSVVARYAPPMPWFEV